MSGYIKTALVALAAVAIVARIPPVATIVFNTK